MLCCSHPWVEVADRAARTLQVSKAGFFCNMAVLVTNASQPGAECREICEL